MMYGCIIAVLDALMKIGVVVRLWKGGEGCGW
jgi:hypothetical protein